MLPCEQPSWMITKPEEIMSRQTQQTRFAGQYLVPYTDIRHSIGSDVAVLKQIVPNLLQHVAFRVSECARIH